MSETIGAAQIELGVDASGVDAGVARAKKSIDSLGDAAVKAGKGGAQGIDDIGKAGAAAADKLDQATKRTIASIERQALALGKTRSEYYAAKAAIDGNAGALAPYIAKLADAEKANKSLGDTNKNLGQSFSDLAQAAGAVVSIGAIVASLKGAIDAADHLKDLNKVTGITVEQLSGLRLAAKQTGTELDSVAKAIGKMSVEMGKDPAKFAKLGITDKDGLKAFQQFADLLGNIPDLQKKNALSQAVLNKSWQEMAPLLSEGGKKIGEMVDKGTKLSGMTTDLAKASDEFNDKWAELTQTGGLFNRMLIPTLPLLTALADDMLDAQQNTDKFKSSVSPLAEVLRATVILAGNVGFTFTTMGKDIARAIENVQLIAKGDFAGSRALGAMFKKDAEDSRAAFDAWEKKMLEAGKTSTAVAEAVVTSSGRMTAAQRKASAAADDFINADKVAGQLTEFRKLMNAAIDLDAVSSAQLLSNAKLTSSEAALVKGLRDIDDGTVKATVAERASYEIKMKLVIANEKLFASREEMKKTEADWTASLDKETKTLADQLTAAQDHLDSIGKTKEQQEALIGSKRELEAAGKDEYAQALENAALYAGPYADAYMRAANAAREQAKVLREISSVKASSAMAEAADAAAKQSLEEWKRGWEETDRLGREVFTDWAMDGSNAAKKIGDTLKKALLSAIYEATLKPIAFQIYSSVTGGVAGSAAGGMASGAGSSMLGSYLASTTAGAYASGMYAGAASMASQAAIGSSFVGPSAAYASGSVGAGASIATAVPYVAAFVAAVAVLSKIMNNGGTPSSNTGDMSLDSSASGAVTARTLYGASTYAQNNVASLQASYMQQAIAMGITAGAHSFTVATNNGANASNPMAGIYGSAGSKNYYSGEVAQSDTAGLQLAASRAVFVALQGSELPSYLSKLFDGLTASGMTLEQINSVEAYAAQLKSVRDALTETRTPLQILQDQVKEATTALSTSATTFKTDFVTAIDAGIAPDKLAQWQALGTSLDNLAAASGQASEAVDTVKRSLADIASERKSLQDQYDALTMTSTQLLAKQRDAIDESNRALFDQVQVATVAKASTDALAKSTADAAAAADALAASQKQAADQLKATNQGWTDQLSILQGIETDRSIALRDATDESTKAIMKQVYAAQDAKAANDQLAQAQSIAAQAQSKAAQDAIASATAIANERQGLQNQLDALVMTPQQLTAKQRDALDPGNRGLFDQIQSAQYKNSQDQLMAQIAATIAANAEQARRDQAVKDAAIASQGHDLQIQLMEAVGNTAGALAAKRADIMAALDVSLRAIQQQIFDATDAAEASKVAADAAKEQAAAQKSLLDSWQKTADSIGEVMKKLRGQLSSPSQNYAQASRDFNTAIDQTNSGNLEAANNLPALASALVELGKGVTSTGVEQSLLTARTLAAMQSTLSVLNKSFGVTVPAFASGGLFGGGVRLVGEHGPEMEVTGSARIYSFDQTRRMMGNDELLAEIKALRKEVADLRSDNTAENRAIAGHTAMAARVLRDASDGDAVNMRAVA